MFIIIYEINNQIVQVFYLLAEEVYNSLLSQRTIFI